MLRSGIVAGRGPLSAPGPDLSARCPAWSAACPAGHRYCPLMSGKDTPGLVTVARMSGHAPDCRCWFPGNDLNYSFTTLLPDRYLALGSTLVLPGYDVVFFA